MKLKFINQTRGCSTWKFSNSVLTDTEFVNKVKQNINEVITEYEYDSDMDLENLDKTFRIDSHLLWETITMKIRGTAISCSSFKKKEKDKNKKFLHEKFEKIHNVFIKSNSELIQQEMDMVEMEHKILKEEKINGIITRVKVKWQVEGERNTRFFCNLEKKHFTEIFFSKLVVENNQVIQDPKVILTEQTLFYEKLYKSSNPRHEALHNELFLNNDNPFISKPSEAEVYSCEGKITLQECLGA
jgi:hypothetical protein